MNELRGITLHMKYYALVVTFVLMWACSDKVNSNNGSIGFSEEKHDFGKLPFKKEAMYSFEFSNTGKSMLVIYDVKTSCGCAVPEWTKKPIRPGKKGQLRIKYDAGYSGVFHKTAEVFYNGPGSPVKLEIEGEVEEVN